MIEIISFSTISLLLIGMFIYHVVVVKEYNSQIRELSKLIRAKDLTEYAISDNNKDNKDISNDEIVPDFVPADYASDSVFDRMIKRQLGEEEDATR